MEIINNRRSVRSFLAKKIEKENIISLLKAGMQAPSAKNQQAWFFQVVSKRNSLDRLSAVSPYARMLKQAPLALVLYADLENLKTPNMYPQDLAAATQNILLKATSLGIGSCWIGIHGKQELIEALRNVTNLGSRYEPFAIIALGYPQDKDAFYFIDRYKEEKVIWEEK